MKLVLQARTDDELRFAAQLGVDGILSSLTAAQTPNGYFPYASLVELKARAEMYGLPIAGFSLLSWDLCFKWMLGLPGRDEQIENTLKSIRHMGAAGIPLLVFNMHALRFYRTSNSTPERGGSLSTSFEWERVKDAPLMTGGPGTNSDLIPVSHRHPISDEQMWDNYTYFIKAAVPVAEQAGVVLALHPDDPQVPVIAGVARIMRSPEAFRRAMDVVPSDHLGIKFCVGCFSQMGADVVKEIHYFGERHKIHLVDYRNVRGSVGNFRETFLDNGQENMLEVMKAFHDVGYQGPIGPDHAVRFSADGPENRQYWAYAIGYMRALREAVQYFA